MQKQMSKKIDGQRIIAKGMSGGSGGDCGEHGGEDGDGAENCSGRCNEIVSMTFFGAAPLKKALFF